MQKGASQICLVSHQNVAELLGARLPGSEAAELHALVTPQMTTQAQQLAATCASLGLQCELHELPELSVGAIQGALEKLWFDAPDKPWQVNITGGKKSMSIVAHEWATKNGIPAIYVDTDTREILTSHNGEWQSESLLDFLEFEPVLNLFGYQVEKAEKPVIPPAVAEALERLVEVAGARGGSAAVHALNACATRASNLGVYYTPRLRFGEVLDICKAVGKLDYTDSAIVFRDEDALNWCKGLWLEEYVDATLARLEREGRLVSWSGSVVVRDAKDVSNELDAVFTAGNKLHLVECKTSRLARDDINTQGVIYRQSSLGGRLGGIFTRSMICSVDSLTPAEIRRARGAGINIVMGANLKNLHRVINQWIDK